MFHLLIFLVIVLGKAFGRECASRETQYGSVCVCNATYCDTFPHLDALEEGQFKIFTTSKAKAGFEARKGPFSNRGCSANITVKIGTQFRQKIVGFGGAFTDAAGINIKSLPVGAQENIIESYFGNDGIGYSLCRVTLGCSDYSTRPYSYDDTPDDSSLKHFKLQREDYEYKIPYIKQAIKKRHGNLKLFSSVWSPPRWMKSDGTWASYNLLKPKYYQVYADYYKRFYEEYERENITFWGTTTGNEPSDSFDEPNALAIPVLGWIPYQQMNWITNNLGPTLKKFRKDFKILIHDDSRLTFPYVVPLMITNEQALKFIDGIAAHWYLDDIVAPEVLDLGHTDKKDLLHIMTEGCFYEDRRILYGDWGRGAGYAKSILFYLHRGYSGWVDWNMVINEKGGPSYVNNFVDAPVVVNAAAKEFYKQPMFYVLGHFSKFAIPDSVVVDVTVSGEASELDIVAFHRPDKLKAVIIFNNGTNQKDVQIKDGSIYSNVITVQPHSINTVLYK